jgi:hypothetical protein
MPWAWAVRNCLQVGPLRRGAGSMPARLEDQPHRAGRKLVAEPGKFALDPPVAPDRVLRGQSQYQLAQFGYRATAAGAAASRLAPASPHQVPVPAQHRGGGDDPMHSAGLGQQWGQRREHCPIRPRQSRPSDLASEHGDLMPEHQDLRVLRTCAPGQQSEPGYKLSEDQIEQSYRHGRRSCLTVIIQ